MKKYKDKNNPYDDVYNRDVVEDIIEIEGQMTPSQHPISNNNTTVTTMDEVLNITQYEDTNAPISFGSGLVATYDPVDLVNTNTRHHAFAKSFINKITELIRNLNDVELNEEHHNYLKDVGQLQLENLNDLLTLVSINKQMIHNIVHRINAVQAEDYVMINNYNNLINQHIKLIKELQNTYKNIPAVIRKMRNEVLDDMQLGSVQQNEVITEDYGDTQFNNQKALLMKIKEQE